MERNQAPNWAKWDFSFLYANDDEWKQELAKLDPLINKIINLKGKLNEFESFKQYLLIDDQIDELAMRLATYIHYGDLDLSNQNFQILHVLLINKSVELNAKTAWVAPEIKQVGEKTIFEFINRDPKLKRFKYNFEVFFREAAHILDPEAEQLLAKVAKSRSTIGQMYDSIAYADKIVNKIKYEGKMEPVTATLVTKILETSNPQKDQQFRLLARKKYLENYVNAKHSLATVYQGILTSAVEETKLRHYNDTLSMALLTDNISTTMYETLLVVGQQNAHLQRRYWNILKNYFKLKSFYNTDSQLKLADSKPKEYTVKEGQAMVKAAVKPLGAEYSEKLGIALTPGRIDYYEAPNKREGAYSTGGNKIPPIILMNWDNSLRSVATLAHELGHSVHTLFADQYQEQPNANYPIILAEIASTLNEQLLFEYLYKNAKTPTEKIDLLQNRISDINATFFRQIQFAKFEWEAHKLVEAGQPLTADSLADLFAKIGDQFGNDIFTKRRGQKPYSWTRVLHFFHSPYYVYKYATSITAAFKFYDEIKAGNVDTYINFLKAGGHKDPLEILNDANIDLTIPDTYEHLLNNLKELIDRLEKLLK